MASKGKAIGRAFEKKRVAWYAEHLGLVPLVKDKSGHSNLGEAEVARAEEVNQHLDNLGIDIWFKKQLVQEQCKSTLCTGKAKTIDVSSLFSMPEGLNVLATEIKFRAKGKKNMLKWGEVITMTPETFLKLLKAYLNENTKI